MNFLDHNLHALEKVSPLLSNVIRESKSMLPYVVETQDDGYSLQLYGDKGPWLQSQRAPKRESKRLVASHPPEPGQACIILGVGMGYTLLEIFKTHPLTLTIVIEPNPSLIRLILELHDLKTQIEEQHVIFAFSLPGQTLDETLSSHGSFLTGPGYIQLTHNYTKKEEAYTQAYAAFVSWTQSYANRLQSHLANFQTTLNNTLENIPFYIENKGIKAFHNILKNVPALLLGAGPSLALTLDKLLPYNDKFFTLAVSSALKPVLAQGVNVCATNVVDYHHLSSRYFEDLPSPPPLWAKPSTSPHVLQNYSGDILLSDHTYLRTLFGDALPYHGDFSNAVTNVFQNGIEILLFLGCNPIIFCGADHAYSFNLTHLPGTSILDEASASVHRFSSLENQELIFATFPDIRQDLPKGKRGRPLLSTKNMLHAARLIETMVQQYPETQFYNASEEGVSFETVPNKSFEEIVQLLPLQHVDLSPYWETLSALREDQKRQSKKSYALGSQALQKVEDLSLSFSQQLPKAITSLENIEEEQRQNKASLCLPESLKSLSQLYKKHSQLIQLIEQYVSSHILERENLLHKAQSSKLSSSERKRMQIKADKEYYKALQIAFELWIKDLRSAQQKLLYSQKERKKTTPSVSPPNQPQVSLDAYIDISHDAEQRNAFIGNADYSPFNLALKTLLRQPEVQRIILGWPAGLTPLQGLHERVKIVEKKGYPEPAFQKLAKRLRIWNHAGNLHGLCMTSDAQTYGHPAEILEALAPEFPELVLVVPDSIGFLTQEVTTNLIEHAKKQPWENGFYTADGPLGLIPTLWETASLQEIIQKQIPAHLTFHQRGAFWGGNFVYLPSWAIQSRRNFSLTTQQNRAFCKKLAQKLLPLGNDETLELNKLVQEAEMLWDEWVGPFPRDLEVEITSSAPAHSLDLRRSRSKMEERTFQKLLEECKPHSDNLNLTLGGFGDPLEHPEILSFLKQARPYVRGLCLRTFGTALNSRLFQELQEVGLDVLSIRLNKHNQKNQQLQTLLSNQIKQQVQEGRQFPFIVLEASKSSDSKEHPAAFRDQWWSPVSWPLVQTLPQSGEKWDIPDLDLLPSKRKPCLKISEQMIIFADGNIPLCSQDYQGSAILGNIEKHRIQDIWQSKKLQEVRKSHLAKNYGSSHQACLHCNQWWSLIP